MTLPINGSNGRPLQETADAGKSQATAPSKGQARPSASGKGGASGADQLQLSNQAAQMQALEAEIANLPMVDVHRVEEVQQTLATGNYEIRPAEVADKVLTFEAGLGPE